MRPSPGSAELEAFFASAVPLFSFVARGRAVCFWWCRGAVLRGEVRSSGEVLFELVDPDTPEMEELVRGAGADRLLEVYASHPPLLVTSFCA